MATAGPWAVGTPGASGDEVNFGPRYKIQRMLGEGGMGAVYKAHDVELDRPVALKLIRPGLAMDANVSARFKQELLLASKVSHKNILRIHDLGDAAGVKFISMAYVEGMDLHQLLVDNGKLGVERSVKLAKQMCAALDAAHAEGVVHRDFKPQNILLDKNEQVYVTDFGLAKSLEADAGLSRSGELLGTPRYMAPEQVEGRGIDHRVDLYALGLIMYEMLTGDVPFHADSTIQLMYKRVNETPKSPKELNPDLPDWIVRVVMKCIERYPNDRYQSAAEVLGDLQHQLAPAKTKSGAVAFTIRRVEVEAPAARLGLLLTIGIVVIGGAMALVIPSVRHRIFGEKTQTAGSQVVPTKHVVVLPLRVIGDPAAIGYIGDGVVDALTAKLFQLKEVQMAAPSAVARIKPDTPLTDVAKALGANLIVSGSLQGQGDKIRLVLNLDDVSGGKRVWTQEFSGLKQDLLTLEDNAYAKLVAALSINATTDEMARTAAHPTENVDAYDLYLKGRNAMHGEVDAQSVQKAIDFYQKALLRDASFALAYTGISDASMRMYTNTKDATWSQKALGAAQQAQALADNLPEVHFSLGSIYTATGKAAEATAELQHALQLAPNSDDGYRRLGDAYRAGGNKEDALRSYVKATEINPYYWYNFNALGNAYLRFGDNANALKSYQKVTELAPKNGLGFLNMGNAYYKMDKWEDAISAYKKSIELDPAYLAYMNLGTTYFYLKRYPESVENFEKAVQLQPQQEMAVGNLADGYRWSGDRDKANATYDKAIALALKGLQVDPRNSQEMASLALYYAKKGDTKTALNYIRRARAIAPNEVNFIYYEANIQVMAGNTNEALAGLRTAFGKGYPVREAANDPYLYAMQSNPDFVNLLKEFEAKSTAAKK
jgi:tetratricopeptide (TPR) repeat protein